MYSQVRGQSVGDEAVYGEGATDETEEDAEDDGGEDAGEGAVEADDAAVCRPRSSVVPRLNILARRRRSPGNDELRLR